MKRFYALFLLAFLGTQIMAENLNISGNVIDENGNPVSGHEVFINSLDSTAGFFYSSVVYTNESGAFFEVIELDENITQGEITASTESCNDFISATQFFNPGNYDLVFVFEICTDSTGGGNDTIVEGCENYFYYYQGDGFEVQFYGVIEQEGEVSYNWSFGDGTSGQGSEISHTYVAEGSYQVSLETLLNDSCEFVSYQTIYVVQDSSGGGNDSTYCQNDFVYTIDGYIVTTEGWVSEGEVESLFWDFGDGSTVEGMTASHQYADAGTYNIVFTTVYNSENDTTCVAVTTKTVNIQGGTSGEMLYGTVRKGEAFLDHGTVQLFSILNDTVGNDSDIVLFDETTIDSSGMYFFMDVPGGNYLILAQADQQSMYFNQTVPTYYGDVLHWVDATIVALGDPMNPYDINLIATEELANGDGGINGDVIGEGFKSQLIEEDIIVLLLDENYNALSFTLSELNSGFDFSDLAYGTYIVYAEVVGINTQAGMVTLSADNPNVTIDIVVTPNGVLTGLNDIANIEMIDHVYPNPVGSLAQFDLNVIKSSQVEMTVYNQMGQLLLSRNELMNQGMHKVEFNTESLPAGIYFIQIISDKANINQKFIKK
jgi:hypothetical protein